MNIEDTGSTGQIWQGNASIWRGDWGPFEPVFGGYLFASDRSGWWDGVEMGSMGVLSPLWTKAGKSWIPLRVDWPDITIRKDR